jgi:UDP-N-acetylglucosamine acyltransferase
LVYIHTFVIVVVCNHKRYKIREFVTIHRGTEDKFETKIENNCLIMAYVHIGNDCTIESNCILGNNVTLTGHVYVEANAIISALTPVYENVRIGCHAMVGGASYVFQDILPFTLAEGIKANSAFINMVGLRRRGFSEDEIRNLKEAYKIIFKRGNKLEEAIRQMQEKFPDDKNIEHMIHFIRESRRGIAR